MDQEPIAAVREACCHIEAALETLWESLPEGTPEGIVIDEVINNLMPGIFGVTTLKEGHAARSMLHELVGKGLLA